MSTFNKIPIEIRLKETEEEMKSYPGVTDLEAHVMAMSILVPRGWGHILSEDEGISIRKSRRLLISGAKKYILGGGKCHWQGMAERMNSCS